MNVFVIAAVGALVAACNVCSAESLRCQAGIASEGDSRVSLLYKCGPPMLADTYCPPVYYPGGIYLAPEPYASTFVPCQPTEEWIYDRGAGNLVATVRVRSGKILSISYGQVPR